MNRSRWDAGAVQQPWPINEIQLSTRYTKESSKESLKESHSERLGGRLLIGADDAVDCYDWLHKGGAKCELVDPSEGKKSEVYAITFAAEEYPCVVRLLASNARWKHIRPLPSVLMELLELAVEEDLLKKKKESHCETKSHSEALVVDEPPSKHIPIEVWSQLKSYQRESVIRFVQLQGRMYLADDPGLGKTLQAIVCSLAYRPKWPILIICPSSVKDGWRNEFCKWLAPLKFSPTDVKIIESEADANKTFTNNPIIKKKSVKKTIKKTVKKATTTTAAADASSLKQDASPLKQDVSALKEVSTVENDVSPFQNDISPFQNDISGVANDISAVSTVVKGSVIKKKGSSKRKVANATVSADGVKKDGGIKKQKCENDKDGGEKKELKQYLVYVISYDLMIRPIVFRLLQAKKFQVMISDESHFLKNPTAKRTNCFISLANQCPHVIELSGTPGHSPALLYAPLRALQPNLLPPWWVPPPYSVSTQEQWRQQEQKHMCTFAGRWADPRTEPTFGGKFAWVLTGGCRLEEFHSILRRFCMLKRTKDEVLKDLPEKRRIPIYFEVPAHDRQVIQTEMAAIKALRMNKPKEFKARFMRLFNDLPRVKSAGVMEYLSGIYQTERQKSLWFAHHRAMIACLIQVCEALRIKYIVITGETSGSKRQALVDQFQNDPTIQIAVLSMTAAGFGLNLQAASLVIFAELFFGPDTMIQAEDRSHRLGQKAPFVECRYLIAKDTLDEGLLRMVNSKTVSSALMIEGRHTTFAMRRAQRLELSTDEDAGPAIVDQPVTQEELEQDAIEVFQAQIQQLS